MTTDARPLGLVRLYSDPIAQCPRRRPRTCDSANVWLIAQRWHARTHQAPCPSAEETA